MRSTIFDELRAVDKQITANTTTVGSPVSYQRLSEKLERIHTKRLALRPVCMSDAWPLYQATRNSLFNAGLRWEAPADEGPVLERVEVISNASQRGKLAAVSVVLKDTGEWVSLFRFQPYEGDENIVELGIWTHHAFWQGGYSLELGKACVDAAFLFSEASALIGTATPENRASRRLMESCGMTLGKAITRKSETQKDKDIPYLEFSITREKWLQQERSENFAQVPALGSSTRKVDVPESPAPEISPTEIEFMHPMMQRARASSPLQTSAVA